MADRARDSAPRLAAVLLALCLGLLAGCGGAPERRGAAEPESEEPVQGEPAAPEAEAAGSPIDTLPDGLPPELTFCSGAGAWRTSLALQSDGSFTGQYTDWDAGPQTYPNGTYYICTFSGRFGELRQLDDTAYAMTLEELDCQETEGGSWVEDETLYIGATPYGLEGGEVFYLYTPDASTEVLSSESLRIEWPQWDLPASTPEGTLGCWGLFNVEMDQGFFSYQQ